MMRRLIPSLILLLTFALTACGDLPEPFLGNPGATARRLAQPLSPLLAVPPPSDALLTDAASQALADELATALQKAEVPALARTPRTTDWRLVTKVEQRGPRVVPIYTVIDPNGEDQGSTEGADIPVDVWATASPNTLNTTAADAGPKIAALLTSIRVARDQADPNSLYNRAAKVMVADVTGAPGDGNLSLTREMRKRLGAYGPVIQTTVSGADFVVRGEVKVVPIPNRQERVEIQWIVSTPDGDERGRVVQLNEIPAGTLSGYWADVAVVVAAEASAGINDVLIRQSGREPGNREPAPQPESVQSGVAPPVQPAAVR
ncbi:MAG: hypothetical protein AB7F35_12745 [Acetobacteraceae bacterium]